MSAASTQLGPKARIDAAGAPRRRSLSRLLHAINQPLTGLQCSMELALAIPRRPEQYVHTLRAGVELTHRMGMLVEAMREVIDMQESKICSRADLPLQELLLQVGEELLPVAETRRVRIGIRCDPAIRVAGDRKSLVGMIFRLIDSVLSLAAAASEIGIAGQPHGKEVQVQIQWYRSESERTVELCPADLGLLVVEAWCEQIGGRVERCSENGNSFTIWLPSPSAEADQRVLEETQ
jgi:signal transduction histidine kinase